MPDAYQSLLPSNATKLEQQMEQISAELILSVDFDCRTLWSPVDCPSSLLPYLASAIGLDEWNDSIGDYLKRDAVANAIEIQSKKGTIYSIKSAIANYGVDAVIQEYRNSPDTMAPCTCVITTTGIRNDIQEAIEITVYKVMRASDSFTLVNGVTADTQINMMGFGSCITFQRFECSANAEQSL